MNSSRPGERKRRDPNEHGMLTRPRLRERYGTDVNIRSRETRNEEVQIEHDGNIAFLKSNLKSLDKNKNKPKRGVTLVPSVTLNYSKLLRDIEVPEAFRERYILTGYRPRNLTALECARSVFHANNETVNFWSHFLSGLLLIARYCYVVWYHNPLSDHFYYPLTSFTLGCFTLYTMSCLAHMFSSMTEREFHIGYYLDYAAISVYTFTAGQAFYFYCHPIKSGLLLYDWRELFLFLSALISFGATYSCCMSRHHWLHLRFIIRTGSYMVSWVHNCSPYFVRQLNCSTDPFCNPDSFPIFIGCFLSFATAALANMTRVPERFFPGAFDFIGQSHHFLHVMTTLGDHFAYSVFLSDLEARKGALTLEHIPAFTETIGLTLLVLAGNLGIVFWFAKSLRLTSSGIHGTKKYRHAN